MDCMEIDRELGEVENILKTMFMHVKRTYVLEYLPIYMLKIFSYINDDNNEIKLHKIKNALHEGSSYDRVGRWVGGHPFEMFHLKHDRMERGGRGLFFSKVHCACLRIDFFRSMNLDPVRRIYV